MTMNGQVHQMPDGSLMAGPPMDSMPAIEPLYSDRDIVEMVNTHERDTEPLRRRMRGDQNRYRLLPHVNKDPATGERLDNYAVYTSPMPRVFADKVISWITLAELLIRVRHVEAGFHEEETDNLKERFVIGNLKAADERLRRLKQPSLRGQQAFYSVVRGGYIGGRCLLVNNPDGSTYADITAWDPAHIHFEVGADGLEWACHKIKKTKQQIYREYGVELNGRGWSIPGFRPKGSNDPEREGIWVYDFYDGYTNTVITDSQTLKEPMPHGSPRVPVYLTLVGSQPVLQMDGITNSIADVGESVYSSLREVYEKNDDIMSIMLEIVSRARRQTVIIESRDGKKTLKDDPFKSGQEISVAQGDKIYTLELQRMAAETADYMTVVFGDLQRASLPYSSYGETPFQLSGYAITQLRQATETVLASRLEAVEDIYLQIANLLYDQFMTGAFNGMRLSGVDSARNYFSQTITPQVLVNSCDYSSRLVSQLPQDDAAKWAQAQIAKDTQLMADEDILNEIMQVEDAKQMMDKVLLQKARQGLPEAVLFSLGQAAADRGDLVTAKMYLMEFDRLMAQKWGLLPPDGQPQNGKVQAKPKGQEAETLPAAAQGQPPQPETSNNGPSYVAPGTPRNTGGSQ